MGVEAEFRSSSRWAAEAAATGAAAGLAVGVAASADSAAGVASRAEEEVPHGNSQTQTAFGGAETQKSPRRRSHRGAEVTEAQNSRMTEVDMSHYELLIRVLLCTSARRSRLRLLS